MKIELDMLTEICDQINKPGGEQIAKNYVNLFSARKISKHKNQVLFTSHMLSQYEEYLLRKKPNYREEYKDEFKKIDRLLRSYKQITDSVLMILDHFKRENERPVCEAITNISGESKKCYWLRWDAGWYYCIIFNFTLCQSGQQGSCKQPGKWRVYYDARLLRREKLKSGIFALLD